jgi:hypothetical protein
MRWYGDEPNDNVNEQTGTLGRSELDFSGAADPISQLNQIEDSAEAVQGVPYPTGQLFIQRLVGLTFGVTNPSGDADIIFQIQSYKADTKIQTDIGPPITFGPAEFGKKLVTLGVLVAVDEFLFVRGTYPDNWIRGDKQIKNYVVLDLVN